MTENKRYSFNWERGHPNFWDNHCDLADCYLTCGDVVNILNELNDENEQLKQGLNDNLELIGQLQKENEQLKKELKRCRDWLNSDKNDYQLTLAFIKSKGYSLKDVIEYEKELEE